VSIFSLRSLGFKPATDVVKPSEAAGKVRLQESIERALAWAQIDANAEKLRNPFVKSVDTFGALNGRARSFLGEQIAELKGSLARGDNKGCTLALRELAERAILAGSAEGLKIFLNAEAQTHGLALVAISRDESDLLRILLKKGADANEPGPLGQSLPRISILRLQSKCLEILLEHGAKLTADDRGAPAHWLASIWHRPEIAASLAAVQEKQERKDSRFERANACLAVLARAKQSVNVLNHEGRPPLNYALSGLLELRELEAWLAAGALIAGVQGQTESPLEAFVLASWRPMPLFEALAEALNTHHADFMAVGPSGQSAFDLATSEMKRVLESI